ncbi:MAG: NADH-quinone oxidoreductase subunit NuoE [Bacteroidales bacterium]|jgi:NADH:ubiquinone oxidoreductase subunit E|nr:NADH-quinone oxidoreductase subunit NuoE [Bacteroidales bacterium]MDX9927082.1 NADH-quinone oxidoreductase subunit NuoE [Bacteroidales bacterium]HNX84790.1 NADH-quinone oxidoreductase subunit NuoE [Bacteroidales bacterium]HOC47887.1 NADH-quinone oxidoreductase subunit NuoE [Bacteroidales bacterium]HPS97179.1 NADH-quinone oxidoreductase subunit NuoE [Bacteroidales bacterium]
MSKIDDILSRYREGSHESLIPILQDVQEEEGYLTESAIVRIGSFLRMSTTKIYGLATFYDRFRFIPAGRVHMRICNGTTCFINGSAAVVTAVRETLGIEPGQTTRDGRFSYELTACQGGCNEGPVICIGENYHTRVRPEDVPELIAKLKSLSDLR